MDINNLTIGQAKELSAIFNSQTNPAGLNSMIGKKCIIRTYSAGVWFGELHQKSGDEVILRNARRMWQWHTKKSISLSSIAIHGIDESKSKIAEPVGLQWLKAIEITPCTDAAVTSLENADVADKS